MVVARGVQDFFEDVFVVVLVLVLAVVLEYRYWWQD